MFDKDCNSTTCTQPYLSVLRFPSYWITQLHSWMTMFLAWTLRVILIGVPTSNEGPTSPVHPTTFPTVLPSVLKVKWYPACLLELPCGNRNPLNQMSHFILLSQFILWTIDRPISLNQRTIFFRFLVFVTSTLKSFTKIRRKKQITKYFLKKFYFFLNPYQMVGTVGHHCPVVLVPNSISHTFNQTNRLS